MKSEFNSNTLSWKTVKSLSKDKDFKQLTDYVLDNYKNVGVQQHENNMLFTINNPSILLDNEVL